MSYPYFFKFYNIFNKFSATLIFFADLITYASELTKIHYSFSNEEAK